MKWLFLIPLLFLVSAAALAAPIDDSSCSTAAPRGDSTDDAAPKDCSIALAAPQDGSSTGIYFPKELLLKIYSHIPAGSRLGMKATNKELKKEFDILDVKEEFAFLDLLGGDNQGNLFDEELVFILIQNRLHKESDVRQAVEASREKSQECFDWRWGPSKHNLLNDLRPVLQDVDSAVRQAYAKATDRIMQIEGVHSPYYSEVTHMDVFFALMLKGRDYDMMEFVSKMSHAVRQARVGTDALVNFQMVSHANAPLDPQNYFNEQLRVYLEDDAMYDKFQVWKTVQQARHTIKEERRKAPNAPHLDVGPRMIQILVPLLRATADEDTIRKTMQQARHANRIELAVKFKKMFALRNLVALEIDCPPNILENFVRLANFDVKIVSVLRKHPSFDSRIFKNLLFRTARARDKGHALLPLLLKDKLAILSVLKSGLDIAKESVHPRSVLAFNAEIWTRYCQGICPPLVRSSFPMQ